MLKLVRVLGANLLNSNTISSRSCDVFFPKGECFGSKGYSEPNPKWHRTHPVVDLSGREIEKVLQYKGTSRDLDQSITGNTNTRTWILLHNNILVNIYRVLLDPSPAALQRHLGDGLDERWPGILGTDDESATPSKVK